MRKRLIEAREARGLTQQQAAEALGISQSRLSAMERGQRNVNATEIAVFMRFYKKGYRYFIPSPPSQL